jgi:Fur family ferric uptake transcriptional regulator
MVAMAEADGQLSEEMSEDEILRTIRLAVKKRGVRWTQQREAIVSTFIRQHRHLTAEDLHKLVRQVDPSVSAATVYRTMNLMVDIGMAAKRNFQGGSAAFDLVLGKGHHHHLIDVDSGRIIEFTNDEMEAILDRIARDMGYRIACHKIELFGVPLEELGKRKAKKKQA